MRSSAASKDAESVLEARWVMPDSALTVLGGEENVLGRGAYGEVRKAVWHGVPVAAKRLHALSGAFTISEAERLAVRKGFLKEMEILSDLRHPNLLLFLGITLDSRTRQPEWIVTERMETSLYSILHERHLELSFPEIVDIALGVAQGLVYLHEHSPPIIHRDISARNVLIDGRIVKIGDLGQAKFSGTASTNTAVPGAFVYSAPEVLTGAYTHKIDIFSFGVMLVELITGQPPSIEQRTEHVAEAQRRAADLAHLIQRCVMMEASKRPSAVEIVRVLENVKIGSEYAAFRPDHNGGVLVERTFRQLMQAAKDEGIDRGRASMTPKIVDLTTRLTAANRVIAEQEMQLQSTRKELDDTQSHAESLNTALNALQSRMELVEAKAASIRKDSLRKVDEATAAMEKLSADLAAARAREEAAVEQVNAERKERNAVELALQSANERMKLVRAAKMQAENSVNEAKLSESEIRTKLAALDERVNDMTAQLQFTSEKLKQEQQTHASTKRELSELEARLTRETLARRAADRELSDLKAAHEQVTQVADRVPGLVTELEAAKARASLVTTLQAQLRAAQDQLMAAGSDDRPSSAAPVVSHQEVVPQAGAAGAPAAGTGETDGTPERARRPSRTRSRTNVLGDNIVRLPELVPPTPKFQITKQPTQASVGVQATPEVPTGGKEIIDTARRAGVQELVSVMLSNPGKSSIQWRGCNALRDFAYSSDAERLRTALVGGIHAVMLAMESLPEDPLVQQHACQAVMNLCYNAECNRTMLVTAGIVPLIVTALARFCSDANVVSSAMGALANLGQQPHACAAVLDHGGVRLIVDAMAIHVVNPKIIQRCAWALLTMATNLEFAAAVALEGGAKGLVDGMRACAASADVQLYGCWAIANMTAHDVVEIRHRAILDGAAVMCKEAMTAYDGCREKATQALQHMLQDIQ